MADNQTELALHDREAIGLIDMINDDQLYYWTKKFDERLAQAEHRGGHSAAVTDVDLEK
jgi:hypothetical protein